MPPAQDGPGGGDLDNLLDPVLSVLVNGLGWSGGSRPNLRWIAASKRFEGPKGAEVELGGERPPWPPESAEPPLLDDVYDGPLPTSASDPVFADWVRERIAGPLGEAGRVAARLSFAAGGVNLGDMGTGKIKPLIDGLWPLLGGTAKAPEDWRIRVLLVEKGVALETGVAVTAVQLPSDPTP